MAQAAPGGGVGRSGHHGRRCRASDENRGLPQRLQREAVVGTAKRRGERQRKKRDAPPAARILVVSVSKNRYSRDRADGREEVVGRVSNGIVDHPLISS